MSNTLLLIFSGVLFLFNLILTFIISKLKKECDLNAEYSKNVAALDLAVKHYKQSAKEKVRKLTYITKR